MLDDVRLDARGLVGVRVLDVLEVVDRVHPVLLLRTQVRQQVFQDLVGLHE